MCCHWAGKLIMNIMSVVNSAVNIQSLWLNHAAVAADTSSSCTPSCMQFAEHNIMQCVPADCRWRVSWTSTVLTVLHAAAVL
jgi:hypothetical protein